MSNLQESINHWSQLAIDADNWAAYEEAHGSSGAAHRNKAQTYRDTAKSLQLELDTGKPHCNSCFRPLDACPCIEEKVRNR